MKENGTEPGTNSKITPALFYQPRGGNNPDRVGSNSNLVVCGHENGATLTGDGVLIDFGTHPARWTPDGWRQNFPDIRDLLDPKSPVKLRAIFLTHGHSDHDEAIVRYAEAGFMLPPVYGTEMTHYFLREKLRGARVHPSIWPELRSVKPGEKITDITGFEEGIMPVAMGHSLPGVGYLVRGAGRGILFSSDFKLDQTTLTPSTDLNLLATLGRKKLVDVLCVDSTRAQQTGTTPPEQTVRENLLEIVRQHTNDRINIVTLGSNAEGIARAGWLALQTSRVLVHHGKSVERTLRAMNTGGIGLHDILDTDDLQIVSGRTQLAHSLHPSYVLNVLAGAQAESGAVLARASRDEDRHLQFGPEDVVIFSASILPWNSAKVQRMAEQLKAQGVEHVYLNTSEEKPLHASGHEHAGGLLQLAELVNPQQAIVGLHGSKAQRAACHDMFNQRSGSSPSMEMDNGHILRMDETGAALINQKPVQLVDALIRPHAVSRNRPMLKAA